MITENDAIIKKRYNIVSIFMPAVCVLLDFLGLLISGFDNVLDIVPELCFTACFAFIYVFYADLKKERLLADNYRLVLIILGAGLTFLVPSCMDNFGIALVLILIVALFCAFLNFESAMILVVGFDIYIWAFDPNLIVSEIVTYSAAVLMVCVIIAFSDMISKLVYSIITFSVFFVILNIIFNQVDLHRILNMTVFTIWLYCIAVIVCLYFVKNILSNNSETENIQADPNRYEALKKGNPDTQYAAGLRNDPNSQDDRYRQGEVITQDDPDKQSNIDTQGYLAAPEDNGKYSSTSTADNTGNYGNTSTADITGNYGNTSTADITGNYGNTEIPDDAVDHADIDSGDYTGQTDNSGQNDNSTQADNSGQADNTDTAESSDNAAESPVQEETADRNDESMAHQSNQALFDSIQELSARLVKLESENSVLQLMLNSSVYDLQTVSDPDYPYILKLKEESPKYYNHCLKVAKISAEAAALISCDSEEAYAIGMYIKAPRILGDGASSILSATYKIPRNIISAVNKINNKINASVMTREAGIVMLTDDIINTINYLRSKNNGDVSIERIVNNTIKVRKEQNYLRSAGFTNEEIQLLRLYYNDIGDKLHEFDLSERNEAD